MAQMLAWTRRRNAKRAAHQAALQHFGAKEESRTLDVNLGKVALQTKRPRHLLTTAGERDRKHCSFSLTGRRHNGPTVGQRCLLRYEKAKPQARLLSSVVSDIWF